MSNRNAFRLFLCLGIGACSGTIDPPAGGGSGATGGTAELPGPELAASSRLRRMTVDEFNRTLFLLLGDPADADKDSLPDDARKPFDNDFTLQSTDSALVGGVELLARDVASRLLADKPRRDKVVGCTPATAAGTDASDCLRKFVTRFGRLAWRVSLSDEQVATLVNLGMRLAGNDNNFYSGVDAVVQAILQDTEFLYRIEVGTPVAGATGLFKLTGPEMAARLSFFLWGSAPDGKLLDLADGGGLDTPESVRAAAAQMLATPAAQDRIARFHAMWMGYERPPASPLAEAMKQETDHLMTRVIFEQKAPWQDLMRSQETYATYDLAVHYGITPPATLKKGTTTAAWIPYTGTGTTKRQGLLSHATLLSMAGTSAERLMTIRRGKVVRERLFCQELPPKPAVVDPGSAVPKTPCKTDALAVHSQAAACSYCHKLMDPVGFGLDNYDSVGKFRASQNWQFSYLDKDGKTTTKENAKVTTGDAVPEGQTGGVRCDITGDGDLNGTKFNGPAELSNLMLASPDLNSCAVKQLYRFAMGRTEIDATDQQFLDLMGKRVGAADFKFDELLLDFVSSGAFSHFRQEN